MANLEDRVEELEEGILDFLFEEWKGKVSIPKKYRDHLGALATKGPESVVHESTQSGDPTAR